jgi:hypothetical protein
MSDKPKPYPKNVEGDFYVEDGCCITCLVPEFYAPSLMAFDETDSHCFVAKQPTNEDELYQAIKATWAAEIQCIRYGGQNPQILRRLIEAELVDCCDQKHLIGKIEPLLRNHTTFENPEIQSELEIASQFREYILMQSTEYLHYKASKIVTDKLGITFAFSWYEETYYSVWFNRIQSTNSWHIFHSPNNKKIGSRGISVTIDEWLRSTKTVVNIKWYTDTGWNKSFGWLETPI